MTIESHPLTPFLPENATVLFLGSFPPPKARWSMDFFYPNWINDFWRIQGLLYFGDKAHFEVKGEKRFDRARIVEFCNAKGLAFYDTATKVCRLKDNASDNFLEIVEPTDVCALLAKMPHCTRIVTTGGKASEELLRNLQGKYEGGEELPEIGGSKLLVRLQLSCGERDVTWWRMPSTSRAYPLRIDKKAEYYKQLM